MLDGTTSIQFKFDIFFKWLRDIVENAILDKWDWIAVLLSLISLAYVVATFQSQKKTENNTMKITPETQIGVLIDFCRHGYANLVATLSIQTKMHGLYEKYYPAEYHFMKLTLPGDSLQPNAFWGQKERYNILHNLLLLIRNYNIEIEVIKDHFRVKTIPVSIKLEELQILVFKASLIAERCCKAVQQLWPEREYYEQAKRALIREGVMRIREFAELITTNRVVIETGNEQIPSIGVSVREYVISQAKSIDDNFEFEWNGDSFFYNNLFKDDAEFFNALLKLDVYNEVTSLNSQGVSKIMLIPF